MENIRELRKSLADNYDKIEKGEMTLRKGKELTNAAGKIVSTLKVELDYNKFMDIKKNIPFLEVPS